MRIREAREADAAAAAALWTEAYTLQGAGEGRRRPYDEGDLGATAAAAVVLVAESDAGQVVGIAAVVPAAAPRGAVARAGEAELSRLAVAGSGRRQGVGRALARRCLELAREEGAEAVVLWSRPYQRAAHSLYESLGFRPVPERDGSDRDGRRRVFALSLVESR